MKERKLIAAVTAVYFVLMTVIAALYIHYATTAWKAAASGLFFVGALVFALIAQLRGYKGYAAFKWLVLGAAALCLGGDIAIDFNFVAGMALFGAGHILYLSLIHI